MRRVFMFVLALALCLPALAPAQDRVLHTVQGTYLRSEIGAYHHVVFQVQGQELSLFCHPWFADALDAIKPEGQVIITYAEESMSSMFIPEAENGIAVESLQYVNIPDHLNQGISFQLGMVRDQD